MEVREAIDSRRSIRKFKDERLVWELVEEILDAGRKAPASGNIQNTRIIVVTDDLKKDEVAQACLKQNWIAKAPVVLVLCNNSTEIKKFYGDRGIMYGIQNCAAVAENMLLMATDLGVGSCWIGAFNEKAIKKSLRITDETNVEVVIPLGYSDITPIIPKKIDVDKMVFHNEWKKYNRDVGFWPLHKQVENVKEKIEEIKSSEFVNDIKNKVQNIRNKLALWFIKRKI